ncbi:DinB family protein [Anditalea andensis]|uniref:Damage-inducible protein DinB n=1 Tax=Anditalea andensis TaxID=1048983 RepID=A0A074L726_9BACT|nr:DinB family protein [Anditalea andensis]KEO75608.1 hypothetical protein EL17_00515 [Anditalea andensis]
MKQSSSLLFFFLIAFQSFGQDYFRETFPQVWQRTIDYTLSVAESMPADRYDFKPEEGFMSFGEQMLHIAGNIEYLTEKITGEKVSFYDREQAAAFKKKDIISILMEANAQVAGLILTISSEALQEEVTFGNVKMSRVNLFYLLRDHQTHHRGQAVVYLRLNEIKVPAYVGW